MANKEVYMSLKQTFRLFSIRNCAIDIGESADSQYNFCFGKLIYFVKHVTVMQSLLQTPCCEVCHYVNNQSLNCKYIKTFQVVYKGANPIIVCLPCDNAVRPIEPVKLPNLTTALGLPVRSGHLNPRKIIFPALEDVCCTQLASWEIPTAHAELLTLVQYVYHRCSTVLGKGKLVCGWSWPVVIMILTSPGHGQTAIFMPLSNE